MADDDPVARADAATILNEGLWDTRFVPVSAVVIIAAVDPETGAEFLFHRHDNDASVWKHIGMLTVVLDTLRAKCQEE